MFLLKVKNNNRSLARQIRFTELPARHVPRSSGEDGEEEGVEIRVVFKIQVTVMVFV